MAQLGGTSRYVNYYEEVHDRLLSQSKGFFDETDWRRLVASGNEDDLNLYIAGIDKLLEKGYTGQSTFGSGPNDYDTRFMSIINEAFNKEDTKVDKYFVPWSPDEVMALEAQAKAYHEKFIQDARDYNAGNRPAMYDYSNEALNKMNAGGQEKEITAYEYTKALIQNRQMTLDNALWDQFVLETTSANHWLKTAGDVASIAANIGIGVDKGISGFVGGLWELASFGVELVLDDIWRNPADWGEAISENWNNKMNRIDSHASGIITNVASNFQDIMIDFESDYTHFRDEYGTLTTAGNWMVNAAQTAGEMIALQAIGGVVGKAIGAVAPVYAVTASGGLQIAGYTSKVVKLGKMSVDLGRVVGTTVYYGTLTARSIANDYVDLKAKDPSISTASIIANNLTSTIGEIMIENLLGKFLGKTFFDKWLLGGNDANPQMLKSFWRYLGLQAKGVVQEGFEEGLQELSGIAIDEIFSNTINENFGGFSDTTFETIRDAFAIGMLVSAGHSAVRTVAGVIGAEPTIVKSADGKVQELGKLDSFVYGYNLQSYFEAYNLATGSILEALDSMYKALPVSEQIVYLTEEIADAEQRLKDYHKIVAIEKTGLHVDEELNQKVLDSSISKGETSKIEQYRASLHELKIRNYEGNIANLKSKLAKLEKESAKTQNDVKVKYKKGDRNAAKRVKEIQRVKTELLNAFGTMVATAKMLGAFSAEIGQDQIAKAEEILTGMTNKVRGKNGEAKLDPAYIAKTLNELTSVLQIKGIHVSKKDIEKLKKSGNTKLLELYGLEDVLNDKKKETPNKSNKEESNDPATPEEKERQTKVILEKIYKGSKKIKNVAVTEAGNKAVELEDGETLVVPEAELKQGAIEIFKDLAEQKLVETLMSWNFKGDVIARIVKTYQDIFGKDKTAEEAIYNVCFNKVFFMTMLEGNASVPLADRDMFQFLASLQTMFDTAVADDVKTEVYKTKIAALKEDMTECLFEYALLQPNAEIRLDIFTSAQKAELIAVHEAGEFANRIVTGTFTPADWKLIEAKVAGSGLSETVRKNLLKDLKSNKPTKIRKALIALDDQYEILFNGAYNGQIYMPATNKRNIAFNHFLYTIGHTIETLYELTETEIKALGNNVSQAAVMAFRKNQFEQFTNGRYTLSEVSVNAGSPDPRNGTFKCDTQIVTIKRNAGISGRKRNVEQLVEDVIIGVDEDEKTTLYRESPNAQLVNSILDSSNPKDYYTIDDVISNTNLLSNEIKAKIENQYGEVNDDTAYLFLKTYFLEQTNGRITLSLTQNNEIVFASVVKSKDLIDESKIPLIRSGETKLSALIKPQYRIPIFDNITIVISPKESSLTHEQWAGKDTYKLRILQSTLRNGVTAEHLAHEAQHAIQIANKLNFGAKSDILKFFDEDVKNQIIKEVQENAPELFEGVTLPKKAKMTVEEWVVNQFLYTASGEIEAYGAHLSDAIDFYPVVVKVNNNKTLTVTLPWGNSFTTALPGGVSASRVVDEDTSKETVNEYLAEDVFKEFVSTAGLQYDKTFKDFSDGMDPIERSISLFNFCNDAWDSAYEKFKAEGMTERNAAEAASKDPTVMKLYQLASRLAEFGRAEKIHRTVKAPDKNDVKQDVIRKLNHYADMVASIGIDMESYRKLDKSMLDPDEYTDIAEYIVSPFTGEMINIPKGIKKGYQGFDDNGIWTFIENSPEPKTLTDCVMDFFESLKYESKVMDFDSYDDYQAFVKAFKDFFVFDYRIEYGAINSIYERLLNLIRRIMYADVFYSQIEKAVSEIKDAKIGAQSLVSYLKGRGVKDEEIKWSGIQDFVVGKKSVTKEELLQFVRENQLQIEEIVLTHDARWYEYSVASKDIHTWNHSNYRELLFKLPDSDYTNDSMQTHWGANAGVIAHARVHDRNQSGLRILFIDEVQSDWHNEAGKRDESGNKIGYATEEYDAKRKMVLDELKRVEKERERYIVKVNNHLRTIGLGGKVGTAVEIVRSILANPANRYKYHKYNLPEDVVNGLIELKPEYDKALNDYYAHPKKPPEAPFSETYHEYVIKRLVRMAAEQGYDAIAWTHSDTHMARWNPYNITNDQYSVNSGQPLQGDPEAVAFLQAYINTYDKRMVKAANKIGNKFNAKVAPITLNDAGYTEPISRLDDLEEELTERWGVEPETYREYDELGYEVTIYENPNTGETVRSDDVYEDRYDHNKAWIMDITDEMRKSVLFEGQPLYIPQASSYEPDIDENLKANLKEDASIDDVRTLFAALNKDKDIGELFERVVRVIEQIGRFKIHFRDTDPEFDVNAFGDNKTAAYTQGLKIVYDSSYLTDNNQDAQYRATVILHEMIHAITMTYLNAVQKGIQTGIMIDPSSGHVVRVKPAMDIFHVRPNSDWSDGLKGALALMQIYEQMKTSKDGYYGDTSVAEFTAELANADYRNVLKKRNLWTKIIDCIKRILGIGKNDALSAAMDALYLIIDSYGFNTPGRINPFSVLGGQINRAAKRGRKTAEQIANNKPKIVKSKQDAAKDLKAVLDNLDSDNYRRMVSEADGVNTNLRAFKGQQLSKELRGFILEAWYTNDGGVNKGIWDHILNGTLTRADVYDFIYNMSDTKRNEETFRLINKHFFKNEYISSIKELDEKTEATARYYGVYKLFTDRKISSDLLQRRDPKIYDAFMALIDDDPELRKSFEAYAFPPPEMNRKKGDKETVAELIERIDKKQLRRLWLKAYNGDIYSIGSLVRAATTVVSANYASTTSIKTKSLNSKSRGKDGEGRSLEEKIEGLTPTGATADDQYYVRLYSETDELYDTPEEAIDVIAMFGTDDINEIRKKLLAMYRGSKTEEEIDAGLKILAFALEASGKKGDVSSDTDLIAAVAAASKRLSKRKPENIVRNLRRHARDITELVKSDRFLAEDRKKFLRDNKELFDENFELKHEAYSRVTSGGATRYLEDVTLLQLEKYLKELKTSLKAGLYDKRYKELSKQTKDYHRMILKAIEKFAKEQPVDMHVSNDAITVNSDREMPKIVEQLINTQLTKYAPTRVQLVSEENEVHVKMSMSRFISDNIDTLNGLTQGEVDEVIDYYLNTMILPETNRGKLYLTVEQFMLGYLWKANEEGNVDFALTADQIDKITGRLGYIASLVGTAQTNWREILRSMNLMRERASAAMDFYDTNVSDETKKEMVDAIVANDPELIKNAKIKAYNELKEKYSLQSTTFWEKAVLWQRIMMLSSPGTWVRNLVSNFVIGGIKTKTGAVIIPGLDQITGLMGLLPQTKASKRLAAKDLKKDGTPREHKMYTQYKIAGTKVAEKYKDFIKHDLLDSGFLDLLLDGLTKYNPKKPIRSPDGHENILEIIQESINNQLFDDRNIAQKFISKMMSDKRAVMKTMLRYLGKMLTEDNVDISHGMDGVVQSYISEAYIAAAHDFMHAPNFFNKFEFYMKSHFRKTKGPKGDMIYFLYKQILPFASSSWNWFVDKLTYTPLGLAKGIMDLIRLETTVNRMYDARMRGIQTRSPRFAEYLAKRNIGRGTVGLVGFIIGGILLATGKAGIDEEDEKYKIWIGSGSDRVYLDLSNLHATSSITLGMAFADGFKDLRNGEFNMDKLLDLLCNVGDEMLNDFVLTDVYESFARHDSMGEYFINLPFESLSMFAPKLITTLSSMTRNERMRYSSGFAGRLERLAMSFIDIGPLNEWIGATYYIDPYTGQRELINKNYAYTIINKLSPVKIYDYQVSVNEQEAIKRGVSSGALPGRYTINDEDVIISSELREKLNVYYGELNAKALDELFASKTKYKVQMEDGTYKELTYRKMTDKQKKAVIERIMSDNSQFSKIYILTQFEGYKYYASDSDYEKLRKLRITKNVYRKTKKLEGFVKP